MATWDITVPAGSGVGSGGTGSSAITEPGDFDGATIDDVSIVGTPTITSDGTTDDTIGIRWNIETSTGTDIWGGVGSDAASACSASIGDSASSANITDGSSPSPAPSTAVAADWDQIAYAANYIASMKNDGETVSWSAFTLRVTYTASAEDNLLADDIQSTSNVTTPAIGQGHALLADDVQSTSNVTTPNVGQEHSLTATSTQATTELSAPVLAESHVLTATSIESAAEVSAPTLAESHALLADDAESVTETSSPALGQKHALLPSGIESATEVILPAVGQGHILVSNDIESITEVSSPVLGAPSASLPQTNNQPAKRYRLESVGWWGWR